MSHAGPTHLLTNPELHLDRAYLNTAAEGLLLQACADAVRCYLDHKATGEPGRIYFWEQFERARKAAAKLFGVSLDQIALLSSTTEALNTIANSIDWQPGDEVVFTSVEFPSNIFPWVRLQQLGVQLKIVHPRDDGIDRDELVDQITDRTRLVTISQVSYATGERIDPAPIWSRVNETGTLLCVDATQAAARIPVDGQCADFTVASSFKWMNSIHGSAIMSVSPRVLSRGLTGPAGWFSAESCFADDRLEAFHPRKDAQRFQAGMPDFASVCSLAEALEFHTPEAVLVRHQQRQPLVTRLRQQLVELDLSVLLPESPDRQAGIVSFSHPDAKQIQERLEEQNIFTYGVDGRMRAAVHWHNTEEDVDRYVSALRKLLCR